MQFSKIIGSLKRAGTASPCGGPSRLLRHRRGDFALRRSGLMALLLIAALTYILVLPPAMAARFIDLSGNWAERYVNILSDRGVIPADDEGKFKPDDPVTRAVLCAWMVKVLGIDSQQAPSQASYPDVKPKDWFYKPIEIMRQNNYIAGYSDGFRPHQFIQRGEVVSILARALGKPTPDKTAVDAELAQYQDDDKIPDWARPGVAQFSEAGLLLNHPDPKVVNSSSLATRADTAALLYKLQEYLYKRDIADEVKDATQTASQPPVTASPETPSAQGDDDDDGAGATASVPAGGYQPAAAPPPDGYKDQAPPLSYAPAAPGAYQGQVEKQAPPGAYLQGNATVIDAGTHFRATLSNTLDSSYNRVGEEFQAMISEPVSVGGVEVLPIGSKLIGQITNVVSAKHFHFSANGKIDVKFIAVQTPDGRRFPLSASVDARQLKSAGGVTQGPVGATMRKTGRGAVKGAKWGGIGGGIIGAATGGTVNSTLKGAGIGALAGTAVGATGGLVSAGVQKGQEVRVPAGTSLPIQLDEPLSMAGGQAQPPAQGLVGGYGQPAAQPFNYPPPVQQPFGYPAPQQQFGSPGPPQQFGYPGQAPVQQSFGGYPQ